MKNVRLQLFVSFLLCACFLHAQQAKYIFFFIGDGMGLNQIQMTELYGAELQGNIGITSLLFTQFPMATIATTYSATNGVTDSAASGTALATGVKTRNGCIGVMKDKVTPLKSIAVRAREAGCKVGVASSVAVNHATPAAFYAHNENRKNYNAIGHDLVAAGFDFYGGADFWGVTPQDSIGLYDLARSNGYTITRGYKEFQKKARTSDRMILFQKIAVSKIDSRTTPYAIDRQKTDLTLSEITRAGIKVLTKDPKKGFFFMIEGGSIDWACHSNDAATVIHEVQDLDRAIGVAYEFYQQHPDETLIVVTADHETGGLGLGTGSYELNLSVLSNQKISEREFSKVLGNLRKKCNGYVSWDIVKNSLSENFGFWKKIRLTLQQEERLKIAYESSFINSASLVESEYQKDETIAAEAKKIINEIALVDWISKGHSASFVPVFALGAGAENFQSRTDNAEIPRKIAEIGGYGLED
ncbi:alkaline phosphatase [Bacteroides stercorirosoris]|jgi:alkaline phosphatase|uniref:Alkaline phosphatase n=1 Tax=Bacteroides stercorirosoris TaxID=871324 RepID=A0A1M6A4L1_9BACE|nr:alkaline phosphatase [Bacteroides stercorirosoris]RGX80376.1 alkaline phosphatase [Bacteroides stercorirosoris]SHI31396.1 alkaline phosphatase [Bacteroides stercorirosoris]